MMYRFDITRTLFSRRAQKAVEAKYLQTTSQLLQFVLLQASFATQKQYTLFLKNLLAAIKKNHLPIIEQSIYSNEMAQRNRETPLIEKTPWGLVSLKKVDVSKNFIQKLLVVKQHGILGFEYHKKKLEKLKVLEGLILIFYANHRVHAWKKGHIQARVATIGDTFIFEPHDEHGLIALNNTVIQETSTNHLDDLYYIYNSRQTVRFN